MIYTSVSFFLNENKETCSQCSALGPEKKEKVGRCTPKSFIVAIHPKVVYHKQLGWAMLPMHFTHLESEASPACLEHAPSHDRSIAPYVSAYISHVSLMIYDL